jgi:hypothetical protein
MHSRDKNPLFVISHCAVFSQVIDAAVQTERQVWPKAVKLFDELRAQGPAPPTSWMAFHAVEFPQRLTRGKRSKGDAEQLGAGPDSLFAKSTYQPLFLAYFPNPFGQSAKHGRDNAQAIMIGDLHGSAATCGTALEKEKQPDHHLEGRGHDQQHSEQQETDGSQKRVNKHTERAPWDIHGNAGKGDQGQRCQCYDSQRPEDDFAGLCATFAAPERHACKSRLDLSIGHG